MPRYAAFLRGVMPTNAKMPDLRAAFEDAGFTDVKTVLSSGNVVFSARSASEGALETKAESAMQNRLGRAFYTIVRPIDALREMLASDPFAQFSVAPDAKRVVTFLRERPPRLPTFPVSRGDAHILGMSDREIFTTYLRRPDGADFMALIESTFGKDVTTRTWDTVTKVAR